MHVQEYKEHASAVPIIITVIMILITAPVGAIFITLLGPKLLENGRHHGLHCSTNFG
jgi:hypothetical protein